MPPGLGGLDRRVAPSLPQACVVRPNSESCSGLDTHTHKTKQNTLFSLFSTQFAAYAESRGARSLGALRSSLQAQSKAFLDSHHGRCTVQLQHLLEVRVCVCACVRLWACG